MDERKGPKRSQKGVSSIAIHLQTHNKIKAAPDQGGEGLEGEGCSPELGSLCSSQPGHWLSVTSKLSFWGILFFSSFKNGDENIDPSYLQKCVDNRKRKGEGPLQSWKCPTVQSFMIANDALPRMKLPSQFKRGKMGGYLFMFLKKKQNKTKKMISW